MTEIFDIDDRDSTFSIMFRLSLEWKDINLGFTFLKDSQTNNMISLKNAAKIWKPEIKFLSYENQNDFNEVDRRFSVHKTGRAEFGPGTDTDSRRYNETYKGAANLLQLETINRIKAAANTELVLSGPPRRLGRIRRNEMLVVFDRYLFSLPALLITWISILSELKIAPSKYSFLDRMQSLTTTRFNNQQTLANKAQSIR